MLRFIEMIKRAIAEGHAQGLEEGAAVLHQEWGEWDRRLREAEEKTDPPRPKNRNNRNRT